ncbi:MAG: aminoacetone oxidase family FAD-binding enzyme, partial [Desulfuromonas sp.]
MDLYTEERDCAFMKQPDVIVIGGGAAGMFAAGFAARQGARVVLLEKNRQCGAKVLITGKGRCNVTHDELDPRKFVEAFGRNGRTLLTALYAFGVNDTVAFFEQRGVAMRVERGGRIFPEQGDANDVQRALLAFIHETGVEVVTDCNVKGLIFEEGRISSVVSSQGNFSAASIIL